MNTLQLTTTIKKEVWEYKKIFLWLPTLIAGFMILTPLMSFLLIDSSSTQFFLGDKQDISWEGFWQQLADTQNPAMFSQLFYGFSSALFAPFFIVATLVQVYYFIACLFDERRDLSILFWRSLPVSDAMSIGVKLLVGALVLPLFFLIAATLTLLLFLIAGAIMCSVIALSYDISLWGLWASSNIITHMSSYWLSLIPYTLWLLPVYAWLMLVSMFSSKAPVLWAILPIVGLLLIEAFIVKYFHLEGRFFLNSLMNYFALPDVMMNTHENRIDSLSMMTLNALSQKISLAGIALSGVFIYLTYWLRTNRSHM